MFVFGMTAGPLKPLAAPIVYHFSATGESIEGVTLDTASSRLANLDSITGFFSFDPTTLIDQIISDIESRTGTAEIAGTTSIGSAGLSVDQEAGLSQVPQNFAIGYQFDFGTGSFSFNTAAFSGFSFSSSGQGAGTTGALTASLSFDTLFFPADNGENPLLPLTSEEIELALLDGLTSLDLTDDEVFDLSISTLDEDTNTVTRDFTIDSASVAPVPIPATLPFLVVGAFALAAVRGFRSKNQS